MSSRDFGVGPVIILVCCTWEAVGHRKGANQCPNGKPSDGPASCMVAAFGPWTVCARNFDQDHRRQPYKKKHLCVMTTGVGGGRVKIILFSQGFYLADVILLRPSPHLSLCSRHLPTYPQHSPHSCTLNVHYILPLLSWLPIALERRAPTVRTPSNYH